MHFAGQAFHHAPCWVCGKAVVAADRVKIEKIGGKTRVMHLRCAKKRNR